MLGVIRFLLGQIPGPICLIQSLFFTEIFDFFLQFAFNGLHTVLFPFSNIEIQVFEPSELNKLVEQEHNFTPKEFSDGKTSVETGGFVDQGCRWDL